MVTVVLQVSSGKKVVVTQVMAEVLEVTLATELTKDHLMAAVALAATQVQVAKEHIRHLFPHTHINPKALLDLVAVAAEVVEPHGEAAEAAV
jgi:hypothetical protein